MLETESLTLAGLHEDSLNKWDVEQVAAEWELKLNFCGQKQVALPHLCCCITGARFKAYIKSLKSCDLKVPIQKTCFKTNTANT